MEPHQTVPRSKSPEAAGIVLTWTALVQPAVYIAGMNAARFFMRREDYQPPQTPADSPFRNFYVSCLKCGSFKLLAQSQFDEESGQIALVLICPSCRQREILPIK
jgi:hypothetical protein